MPHPFNPSTKLFLEPATAGRAQLAVYGVAGNRVVTLVDKLYAVGRDH